MKDKTVQKEIDLQTDEELVERCKKELPYSTIGFDQLLKRYQPVVLRMCLKYLKREPDAEDVCQEVFLRIFHHIKNFEGKSKFRTWLYRIVMNACETRRVKLNKEIKRSTEFNDDISWTNSGEGADQSLREEDDSLQKALNRMPEEDKKVLVLRFISDLPIEEIAQTLGLGLSATKMRLYRALDRFKKVYLEISNLV